MKIASVSIRTTALSLFSATATIKEPLLCGTKRKRIVQMLAGGILLIVSLSHYAAAQTMGDHCRDVLVQDITSSTRREQLDLNWLRLINQDNYSTAKQEASTSDLIPYVGLFSGDYNSFDQRRQQLFESEQYSLTWQEAASNFTENLPSGAITAWLSCMQEKGTAELVAYFTSAGDATHAFLNLKWLAPEGMGSVHIESVDVENAQPSPGLKQLYSWRHRDFLLGPQQFELIRKSDKVVISGTINGLYGRNNGVGASTSFKLAAVPNAPVVPKKSVIVLGNNPMVTLASVIGPDTSAPVSEWESRYPPTQCLQEPGGFKLVVIQQDQYPGQDTNGGDPVCGIPVHNYCMRDGVRCWNIRVEQGCFINTEWLDYYNALVAKLGLRPDPVQICAPNVELTAIFGRHLEGFRLAH